MLPSASKGPNSLALTCLCQYVIQLLCKEQLVRSLKHECTWLRRVVKRKNCVSTNSCARARVTTNVTFAKHAVLQVQGDLHRRLVPSLFIVSRVYSAVSPQCRDVRSRERPLQKTLPESFSEEKRSGEEIPRAFQLFRTNRALFCATDNCFSVSRYNQSKLKSLT